MDYEQRLSDCILGIHKLCAGILEGDAVTILRFIRSRLTATEKSVAADWKGDRAARAEAEVARKERLAAALKSSTLEEVTAMMGGVSAQASTGKAKTRSN